VLENLGPDVGDAREGVCGASVVHEQTEDEEMDGIVLGFVWLKDDKSLVVAAVDYLVDDGWEVASVCALFLDIWNQNQSRNSCR
jgi:hypothetical protein